MNDALAIDRAQVADAGLQTLEDQVAAAWQMRQTDTAAAVALVDAVEPVLMAAHGAPSLRARLRLVRAESSWLMADLPACHAHAAAAEAGFELAGDGAGRSDAFFIRAQATFDGGDFGQARVQMEAACSLARAAGDEFRALKAKAVLANWSLLVNLDDALLTWGDFVELHQQGADPWLATWAHDFQGQVHARRGCHSDAILAFSQSFACALQSGQVRRAIVACTNVAASSSNLNVHELALEWIERGIQIARRNAWPASLGPCLMMIGISNYRLERHGPARAALEEAIAVLSPLRGSRAMMLAHLYMSNVLLATGDAQGAAQATTLALAQAERSSLRDTVGNCKCNLAHSLRLQGRYQEAREAAQSALDIADADGSGTRRIHALVALAQVQTQMASTAADHRISLDYLQRALREGEQMPGFGHAPKTLALAAEACAKVSDFEQALRLMRMANDLRDRAEADAALQRVIALEAYQAAEKTRADAESLRVQAAAQARRTQLLKETNSTLRRLGALGQDITAQRELDPIFVRLHRHLTGMLDAHHVSVWVLDMPSRVLRLRFGMEHCECIVARDVALEDPASIEASCARQEREVLISASAKEWRQRAAAGAMRSGSALLGPLRVRGRLIGVLSIRSQRADAYGERERMVLRSFCAWTAIALDNVAVVSQLDATRQHLQDASDAERRARELAEQATQLKSEFLANISHDLRTPLASLHGYLETLLLEPAQISDADRARYLDAALAQSAKVGRLANELMVLAQLESGHQQPTLRPIALPELLVDVVRKLELSAIARSQRMRLLLAKPMPAALADQDMIDRVLTNLLDNAIQHAPVGSEIRVEVENEGGELLVTVLDTGPGIPAELRRDLFNRPVTVAQSHRPGGGGLGLLIVQRLLQQHGSQIKLIERAGFGAALRFNLATCGPQ